MKLQKLIIISALVFFIVSCHKEELKPHKQAGIFDFQMLYTTQEDKVYHSKNFIQKQDYYTNFGSYITSLTPTIMIGKFHDMAFIPGLSHSDSAGIGLISGDWARDDPRRYADFSNNSLVNLVGAYGGHVIDGYYSVDEICLKYFFFNLLYFYQEVPLPSPYNSVILDQFTNPFGYDENQEDSIIVNNVLKVKHWPLINLIFGSEARLIPTFFVFGNTDSTYIYYRQENEPPSVHNPTGDMGISPVVRSHQYNTVILNTPLPEQTVSIVVTLSFNCTDLIQIYAGNDNIPYTSDDVFVYAPNFWERLMATIE